MGMAYNSTFSYDSNEIRDVCGSLQQLLCKWRSLESDTTFFNSSGIHFVLSLANLYVISFSLHTY